MRIICDFDDTLVLTTECLRGVSKHPERLTYTPGATEFLATYGSITHVLTAGPSAWQLEKLRVLNLAQQVSQITVVPDQATKESVIAHGVSKDPDGEPTIVIGDRLDAEIAYGNLYGAITIRVKVKSGRYIKMKPHTDHERPAFTTRDFYGVMHVLSRLTHIHKPSRARA